MSRRPASAFVRQSNLLLRETVLALLLGGATLAASAATDERVSGYYEDALIRFEKKDHAGAIIQLKNAIQIDRNQLAVQVLLGRALLADAQPAAAEVALLEALKLGVSRAELAVLLAQAYVAQGKQAELFSNPSLKPDGLPNAVRFQLLLMRASAYSDLGNTRTALATIDEARAMDPRSADSWLAEVPIRIRSRDLKLAADAADKALSLAPGSADAWYQKGSVAHVRGDLRGALASYDRAIAAQPDQAEARVTRAGLLVDLQRNAEAAKELVELKRISPREPRAAYLRALLAEREGAAGEVKVHLNEVTALLDPVPPNFIQYRPQLLLLNGLAHFGLNEREKAKPYLESFQRLYGQGSASKLLAQIYLSERNPGRAADVLETYLKGQPSDVQAVSLLASAHMAQGNSAKATSLMQEMLRGNDAPQYRSLLGMSLIGGGHVADGRTELEAAFKRDPSQTQAGMALVTLYSQNREPDRALAVASALAKQRPNDPTVANTLGSTKLLAGDRIGARVSFEWALKQEPGNRQAKLNLARLDMMEKAYDAAGTRLEELLKANDRQTDVMLEMATLAGLQGQIDSALQWLQKAADLAGPRDLKPGLSLVEFHLARNQGPSALEAAKRLLSKGPEEVAVLSALARAQLANGDAAGAKSSLNSVARLAGFDAPTQVQVALLQMRADNLQGAAYSVEKALAAQPTFLPALALMTDIDIRQGAFAKAQQRAAGIVQSHPKRAIGYGLQGDVAAAQGQQAAAVDAYRKAFQVEPSSESVLRLFNAQTALDGGKPAVSLADSWLKANPADRAVRRALANAHARVGNTSAARAGYEALLKLAPTDPDTLNNLANMLLRQNDPGALAVAEKALANAPGNPLVMDTVGWAAFQAKQTDRALQLLREARLRDPDNADIRYHLAVVLSKTGRAAEAKQELDAALRSTRPYESAAAAQTLAQTLK